ncbi:MAG TPA: hypothetical protein PLC54_09450, partial [Spirochaetales bacterium]|nr:hypothetical protein [Spirochaetales bacterium]
NTALSCIGISNLDSASASYATEFLQPLSWTDGKPNAVSFYAGTSASARRLLFTKGDASSLYVDDISALRTDVDVKRWALCIRLGVQDTSPSLVPGLYSFSVWVKKPAGYDFSTDTGRLDNANYAARYISLSMIQFIGGSTQSTSRVWNISDTSVVADPSAWTKLELRLSPSAPFSFRENATGQVLELRIACTGTQGVELEPGSILIAQPSLNFFKDGY